MIKTHASPHWRIYVIASVLVLCAAAIAAAATRLWVLTAIPIGFLFGFFLQKGDLCGASAFSEVLLMKDWRKIGGLWVAIVTAMVGFAALDLLGWVRLNPKPLAWLSVLVGGALFGVGMVLAGGCVSGCLFKAGSGNLNSMAGLLGIALGVAAVAYGPLHTVHRSMKAFVVKAADGGPVTLSSLSHLPYWALALAAVVMTAIVAWLFRKRRDRDTPKSGPDGSPALRLLRARSWKPWQAGLAIGVLGSAAYLSSAASGRNYPLGVTHGVLHTQLLVTDTHLRFVWKRQPPVTIAPAPAPKAPQTESNATTAGKAEEKKVVWWLVALVIGLVAGSWVSGRLSGTARLLPKPPEQIVIAFVGGLMVGTGAAFAGGCVIGNILSGWALMSVGCLLFGVVVVLANWVATYFYLMGGSLFDST